MDGRSVLHVASARSSFQAVEMCHRLSLHCVRSSYGYQSGYTSPRHGSHRRLPLFATKDSDLDTIFEEVWADTQIINSLWASDPARGEHKADHWEKMGCSLSQDLCTWEMSVCAWSPGSLLASQPSTFSPTGKPSHIPPQAAGHRKHRAPWCWRAPERKGPGAAALISGGPVCSLSLALQPSHSRSAVPGAGQASRCRRHCRCEMQEAMEEQPHRLCPPKPQCALQDSETTPPFPRPRISQMPMRGHLTKLQCPFIFQIAFSLEQRLWSGNREKKILKKQQMGELGSPREIIHSSIPIL